MNKVKEDSISDNYIQCDDMPKKAYRCNICGKTVESDELSEHMENEHYYNIKFKKWGLKNAESLLILIMKFVVVLTIIICSFEIIIFIAFAIENGGDSTMADAIIMTIILLSTISIMIFWEILLGFLQVLYSIRNELREIKERMR